MKSHYKYEKTGNTKTFQDGKHIMFELIPISPSIAKFANDTSNYLLLQNSAAIIPEEYNLIDIKELNNPTFGSYMVVISQNIVPVEAEEYRISGTDFIGYYKYGKNAKKTINDEKVKSLKPTKNTTNSQKYNNYCVR